MLELETQLAAMVQQAKALVNAMEALRHSSRVTSDDAPSQPVERMLLHMIAEEEESMRLVSRHLAALHYMVSSQSRPTK